MRISNRWLAAALIIVGLFLSACAEVPETATGEEGGGAAKVEPVAGTGLSRVTLMGKAAERLGIETAPIEDATVEGQQRKAMPYAALLYDPNGDAWAFTNPEPGVFIRGRVAVERVDGERVILTDGPATGTQVVTVGAAELYGAELGVDEFSH